MKVTLVSTGTSSLLPQGGSSYLKSFRPAVVATMGLCNNTPYCDLPRPTKLHPTKLRPTKLRPTQITPYLNYALPKLSPTKLRPTKLQPSLHLKSTDYF
jgi:hypothetical protein